MTNQTRHFEPRHKSPLEILRSLLSIGRWHALRTHALAQLGWEESRRSGRSLAFGEPRPWWPYNAGDLVDQIVSIDVSVLELGAGNSTIWWLERGNRVTAIESSAHWAHEVRILAKGNGNLNLSVADPDDHQAALAILDSQKFDVIVIDHSGNREEASRFYLQFLSEHGILIFDNSDRHEYKSALRLLAEDGMARLDVHGLGPVNAYTTTTSIFFRDRCITLSGRSVKPPSISY